MPEKWGGNYLTHPVVASLDIIIFFFLLGGDYSLSSRKNIIIII